MASENEPMTLDQFLKDYNHLVVVFGIFAGLTAYFKTILPEVVAPILFITLIVGYELFRNIPVNNTSTSLDLFGWFFLILIMFIGFFILQEEGEHFAAGRFFFGALITFGLVDSFSKRLNLDRIQDWYSQQGDFFRFLVKLSLGVIFIGSLIVSTAIMRINNVQSQLMDITSGILLGLLLLSFKYFRVKGFTPIHK